MVSQALNQTGFPFGAAAAAAAYSQQLAAGCWYSPTPTYPSSAAAAAAAAAAATPTAASVQNQFLQGIQGYPYGQYAGYQQGYMGLVV